MDRAQDIGHSDQCILEEVYVTPRRAQGPGARSDIALKWIVAGPEINRLKAFRVNEKWKGWSILF